MLNEIMLLFQLSTYNKKADIISIILNELLLITYWKKVIVARNMRKMRMLFPLSIITNLLRSKIDVSKM